MVTLRCWAVNESTSWPTRSFQTGAQSQYWIVTGAGDWVAVAGSARLGWARPAASAKELLATVGVRDSKKLSDPQVRRLAREVRLVCGEGCAEVVVPPERYNALYAQFRAEGKNLNHLLAWGHSRAIETVLEHVECENVIVDQFADARYIKGRLEGKTRAKALNIVQVPKAEANIAVAAASILARDRFLGWLERGSREFGMTLPKGAAPQVEVAAKALVRRDGKDVLTRVAKLHFKTTQRVLGSGA